jgi:hypothetical protein
MNSPSPIDLARLHVEAESLLRTAQAIDAALGQMQERLVVLTARMSLLLSDSRIPANSRRPAAVQQRNALIIAMHQAGKTPREIAATVLRDRSSISRVIRRNKSSPSFPSYSPHPPHE